MTVEAGIPVTSIERTIMDLSARFDDRQLQQLIIEADRSGRLSWSDLQRVIEEGNGRKGLRRLRRVAANIDPRASDAVSPLEIDFFSLCQKANLPRPQINVLVEGHLVDFYWPAAKLIVETDGYTFHNDRAAFERDHEVAVALTADGYKVLRVTYLMLRSNPTPFLALVAQSLR